MHQFPRYRFISDWLRISHLWADWLQVKISSGVWPQYTYQSRMGLPYLYHFMSPPGQDWCTRPVVSAYAAWHQMVPICPEQWCTVKQPELTAIIQSRRLTLFGHIMRINDNADAKRILLASPLADWRREPGRPRITWVSTVQQDLKQHHLTLPEPADLAQNCPLWRMMSTYGAMQSSELHARNDDDDDQARLAGRGITLLICPFTCRLSNLWIWYFENKWTNVNANRHKWSTGQGHETIKFKVRRSKVKVTNGRR